MREEIFLRYLEKTDTLKSARNLIRGSIDEANRSNFVEYKDVSRAIDGAQTVM